MGLYFLVIRPWILVVGGRRGPLLAALFVPVGLALLFFAFAVVSQTLCKKIKSPKPYHQWVATCRFIRNLMVRKSSVMGRRLDFHEAFEVLPTACFAD
jgi:hypothetical protein